MPTEPASTVAGFAGEGRGREQQSGLRAPSVTRGALQKGSKWDLNRVE